jgi:hypothetical protein
VPPDGLHLLPDTTAGAADSLIQLASVLPAFIAAGLT